MDRLLRVSAWVGALAAAVGLVVTLLLSASVPQGIFALGVGVAAVCAAVGGLGLLSEIGQPILRLWRSGKRVQREYFDLWVEAEPLIREWTPPATGDPERADRWLRKAERAIRRHDPEALLVMHVHVQRRDRDERISGVRGLLESLIRSRRE